MEVVIQPDTAAAVDLVAQLIAREVRANPDPVLGLATGRTMESVYGRLVQLHRADGLDFSRCCTFNLDEYVGLRADDKHSYRHFMDRLFFNQVNIDLRKTHLPHGAVADLEAECHRYESLIRESDGIDLQLLGIGQTGHIGFNEPGSPWKSRTRVVMLAAETIRQNASLFDDADKMPRQAITMGVATIMDSKKCVLLATGEAKARIVAQMIEGPATTSIPATALQSHPHCMIVLDEAAASELSRSENDSMARRWDGPRGRRGVPRNH
jgi:glucosamine-6-phosphate deaminase